MIFILEKVLSSHINENFYLSKTEMNFKKKFPNKQINKKNIIQVHVKALKVRKEDRNF